MNKVITTAPPARDLGSDLTVVEFHFGGRADDPVPEIEELGLTAASSHRVDRRLGLVIALAAAIVGFGLVGHWSDRPGSETQAVLAGSSTSSDGASHSVAPESGAIAAPPLTLLSPAEGATIMGGIVEVHGIARERLGPVHLSVVLGNAILGWTNVDVGGPGPLDVAIRVFAPSVVIPVELRVNQATGPRLELRRSFNVDSNATVNLWSATLGGMAGQPVLVVEGFGSMTTGPIKLTVRSGGRAIATSLVSIDSEELWPGSAGGRMIGLGSFRVRIPMPPSVGSAPLSVELTLPDALDDGTAEMRIVEPVRAP